MTTAKMTTEVRAETPVDLPEPTITPNAMKVLEKRYLGKDEKGRVQEDPRQMFWRVASNLAQAELRYGASPEQVEQTARGFYALMSTFKFLPNSPTLMNAGRELQQLSACFVLPVPDDVPGIFEAIKQQAIIHKTGGGTGFAFSRIRPKNDIVGSTGGIASGPVSFMKIFNTATEQIKQGGTRRGANMAILRVDHPDIREFVDMKMDLAQMTNFNVSVALTDEFMEAWKKGARFTLRNPKNGQPAGEVDAREVMDRIAHNAWISGEPGLFFIDRANASNPVPHVAAIEATNPCLPAETWIHTSKGPRQVRDLVGHPFEARVNGEDHASTEKGFFETGTKPLVEIQTRQGYRLKLTRDHRVLRITREGGANRESEWCAAEDLRPGDQLVLGDHRINPFWEGPHTAEEGYLMGLLVGDGTLQANRGVLSVWTPILASTRGPQQQENAVMNAALEAALTLPHRADFKGWSQVPERREWRLTLASLRSLATQLGMGEEKEITPLMEAASSDFQRAFLRGLFDADGTVLGTQEKGVSIRLSQSDLPRLEAAQRMLLRLGIASRIYKNRRSAGTSVLPDGRGGRAPYATVPQHELVVSGANLATFADTIGFTNEEKSRRLVRALHSYRRQLNKERFSTEVERVEPAGVEPVYDATIPSVHSFDANGFVAHNCGEQDLMPYDSCNLGSIVLDNHMVEVAPGKWEVDWAAMRESVVESVRLLDNVIDMNNYPLPQIEEMSKGTRRIGLGIMGFARMLFKLQIAYDSEEGLDMARQVMRFIQEEGVKASERLARERGPYGYWSGSRHQKAGLAPRRNSYVTTIAPTGTISMIADTSGGCEPEFSLIWYKNVMDGTHLPYALEYFEQVARREGFWYEGLMDEVLKNNGSCRGLARVPAKWQRVFATAMDVAPEWHVKMQAAFQQHVDAAVSKTINLPKSATEADVKKAYLLAYETGCKGITVYRDGSRQDQVMNLGKSAKLASEAGASGSEGSEGKAPGQTTLPVAEARSSVGKEVQGAAPAGIAVLKPRPRPDVVVGTTQRIQTGYGSLYVTLNEDEHGIFELFATLGKSGGYTSSFTEAVSRLVSLALRSGVPPEEIVKQLDGIRSPKLAFDKRDKILSVPDALSKAIRRHISGQLAATVQSRLDSVGVARPARANAAASEGVDVSDVDAEDAMQQLIDRGDNPECPDCSATLLLQEGCIKCTNCGYSEC